MSLHFLIIINDVKDFYKKERAIPFFDLIYFDGFSILISFFIQYVLTHDCFSSSTRTQLILSILSFQASIHRFDCSWAPRIPNASHIVLYWWQETSTKRVGTHFFGREGVYWEFFSSLI